MNDKESTKNPLISVVIVTYFHENYIRCALDSVLAQSEIANAEILIGDDGSQDNTVSILHEYEKKHSCIHVYAHENQGLSRNVYDLFMRAKGEYIAVLEGDDYWIDTQKLRKQIEIIKSNDCVGTACNSLKVDNNGNKLGYWNETLKNKILNKKEILYYQTAICHPSAVMFKNIFKNSGNKFDVIALASRMGGNHSGLINLLANNGGLYLDSEAMTTWRVVQVDGGKNYSSQKITGLPNYYEALKKYEMYDGCFEYGYECSIYEKYLVCKKALKKEVISSIGYKRLVKGRIKYIYSCFYTKYLRAKRKIKKAFLNRG